jgi:hypothetical protein
MFCSLRELGIEFLGPSSFKKGIYLVDEFLNLIYPNRRSLLLLNEIFGFISVIEETWRGACVVPTVWSLLTLDSLSAGYCLVDKSLVEAYISF